jgi:regulator of replication initiation timing
MNRDEEIDIENLKYEVEKLKEENQELQVELDTLKKQLTLTDVGCSKRFEKQDLLKAYQAGVIEQKSINLDTFDFKKLKELQHDSSEWYERYTE